MSLTDYIRDTRGELKHVSWPTRTQAVSFTVIVIVISICLGLYLGLFDAVFSLLIKHIVG